MAEVDPTDIQTSVLATPYEIATVLDAIEWTGDVLTMVLEVEEPSPVPFHAASIVWGMIEGQLRGNVPLPVPFDLLQVSASAAIRWTEYLFRYQVTPVEPGTTQVSTPNDTFFNGFTITELVVLWRYRTRTA